MQCEGALNQDRQLSSYRDTPQGDAYRPSVEPAMDRRVLAVDQEQRAALPCIGNNGFESPSKVHRDLHGLEMAAALRPRKQTDRPCPFS